MTPADWAAVEMELSSPWGDVELLCDGFKLTVQVRRVKPLKYAMLVYVDGVVKGVWSNADKPCEEQRRFMRPVSVKLHKPADLAKLKPLYSAKQFREMSSRKYEYFLPQWNSFKPLQRHLLKNNQVITLVRPAPVAAETSAPVTRNEPAGAPA